MQRSVFCLERQPSSEPELRSPLPQLRAELVGRSRKKSLDHGVLDMLLPGPRPPPPPPPLYPMGW